MSAILQSGGINPQIQGSIIPKPARFLTDLKVKKIAIITLMALWCAAVGAGIPLAFAASPVVATFGVNLVTFSGFVFGPLLIFLDCHATLNNSKDYQSEKVAQEIHKDFKEEGLQNIVERYSLTELVRYGYINQNQADRIQTLYDELPCMKMHLTEQPEYGVRVMLAPPEVQKRVQDAFEALRSEFNFIKT